MIHHTQQRDEIALVNSTPNGPLISFDCKHTQREKCNTESTPVRDIFFSTITKDWEKPCHLYSGGGFSKEIPCHLLEKKQQIGGALFCHPRSHTLGPEATLSITPAVEDVARNSCLPLLPRLRCGDNASNVEDVARNSCLPLRFKMTIQSITNQSPNTTSFAMRRSCVRYLMPCVRYAIPCASVISRPLSHAMRPLCDTVRVRYLASVTSQTPNLRRHHCIAVGSLHRCRKHACARRRPLQKALRGRARPLQEEGRRNVVCPLQKALRGRARPLQEEGRRNVVCPLQKALRGRARPLNAGRVEIF